MNITNSKVVVIDDKEDEVKKLFSLLNKKGIPYNYYSGTNLSELPSKPLSGIRFVFLDFILANDEQSDKNKISTLIANLKKLISKKNGPYIILTWTKNETLIVTLKESILKRKNLPNPLDIIKLDKTDTYKSITKIEKTINSNFKKSNIFNLLLNWESNTISAGRNVLNRILSLIDIKEDITFKEYSKIINKEIEFYLAQMTKGLFGSKINKEDITTYVQNSLSFLLREELEKHIARKTIYQNINTRLYSNIKKKIYPEKSAQITEIFLIMKNSLTKEIPGNIYLHSEIISSAKKANKKTDCVHLKRVRKNYLSNFFNINNLLNKKKKYFKDYKKDIKKKTIPIYLELSPTCDYAQGKRKNIRLLFGVLVPTKFEQKSDNIQPTLLKSKKHLLKKAGNIYISPPIIYHNQPYLLVFDYKHYYSLHTSITKYAKPIFKLRDEFLYFIQFNVSNYLSRPGIFELELENKKNNK